MYQETSGHPAGNAGLDEFINEACKNQRNPSNCVEHFQLTDDEKAAATVIGPLIEEALFREAPSLILSRINREDGLRTLVFGDGNIVMTKREIAVGLVSSALFGIAHNSTLTKLDTETIPAPIAVLGFGLWYLQRKFGLIANNIAHITNNTIAVAMMK